MSWGYFVELKLTVGAAAWKRILAQRPAEIALAKGWSGLEDADLESAFGRPCTDRETFAEALGWRAYDGKEAIRRVETDGDATTARVCLLLDKSQLELAYPLATLLEAARAEGAEGSLRLVNDGTSDGEDGVELKLAKGKIKPKRVKDCWPIVEELGAELFGELD